MTSLEVFTYTDQQVRTILIDGEPWFVARDVCAVLDINNSRQAVARLDPDGVSTTDVIDSMGRTQVASIVNEGALYELIFLSRKPEARDFKRWVTREVLPQIRRTGSYGGQRQIEQMPLSEQLQIAADAAKRAEELEALRAIEAPKAQAFDQFMDADGAYTMDAAAKSLAEVTGGMGRNKLFAWLRDRGVLMSGNRPYQRYAHLFKVIVGSYEDRNGLMHTTYTTYVKPEGLDAMRRWFGQEPPK